MIIRARVSVTKTLAMGARLGGLTKFGTCPGGGMPEGVSLRSNPDRSMAMVEWMRWSRNGCSQLNKRDHCERVEKPLSLDNLGFDAHIWNADQYICRGRLGTQMLLTS